MTQTRDTDTATRRTPAEMRRRHAPQRMDMAGTRCPVCRTPYPCDTVVLLDRLAEVEGAAPAAAGRMADAEGS